MKILKNKTLTILIATLLLLSMTASLTRVFADIYPPVGYHVTTYAAINVAPNPIGIGQTVTVNMYLVMPLLTSENPVNMTSYITDPNGLKTTYGPFIGDVTGGTYYNFVPSILGNYSIYWTYGGQTMTGTQSPNGYGGVINDPSTSKTITLTVQQEPISRSAYPITPLPTAWWETPVTAENIQEWYKITGPWLGLTANSFATTGGNGLNDGPLCNAYTSDVVSGHVLWTLPWGPGGVPGGLFGGTESSNFWMTRQYSPNFAAVIMNGVLYSTQYTTGMSTGANSGIIAIDLFTGQQLFAINTTNPLLCGMMFQYKNPNQYGVVGPWLWTTGTLPAADTGGINIPTTYHTTGTQWNMYDAFNGQYVGSIVNGTSLTLSVDDQGGLVGYYINNTAGTEIVHPGTGTSIGSTANRVSVAPYPVTNTGPHLECFNFTTAFGTSGNNFQPSRNFVIDWRAGIQFAAPLATNISGVLITPSLSINSVAGTTPSENVVCLIGGGTGYGGREGIFLCVSGMDAIDGTQLMLKNITSADTGAVYPWVRLSYHTGAGKVFILDEYVWKEVCYDLRTGNKVWGDITLTPLAGYEINPYDVFNFLGYYANGIDIIQGFGGDIWGINATTGVQMWTTNTLSLLGDPGIETPYGTWPLWVFGSKCQSGNIAYFGVGHEYDPPLFHGAQVFALNMTDGSLVWKELGFYTRAFAIADGVLISVNEYDNQVFAFGKGPTAITVSAPSVGVTTATPITISGRVTDVSPGSEQDAVARNYPNGVPAVSDESQSALMETVYQQQPTPTNITGVPIGLFVLDSNNNYRQIGTTTSDALGTFTYTWTPDIPGDFKVYAIFAGSNSYWPSSASAGFQASLPATHEPTATAVTELATTNDLMYIGVAIIIVIIIIGVVLAVLMTRRK